MMVATKKIKELKEYIVQYMDHNDIDSVNHFGEKVKIVHTKSKQILDEPGLKGLITKYFEEVGDETNKELRSNALASFILEKRAVALKPTIRRLKSKRTVDEAPPREESRAAKKAHMDALHKATANTMNGQGSDEYEEDYEDEGDSAEEESDARSGRRKT
jgi:hypothetical protein